MTTQNQWSEIDLRPQIASIIAKQFHFQFMMPVQQAAIPLFIKNYDVAVEAVTGSGKTLAFLVPIFNQILAFPARPDGNLFALIISPSRELASQIFDIAKEFNHTLHYKLYFAIGGTPFETDLKILTKNGCNILIGTPGKLRQLLESDQLPINIKTLEYLVLDEADRLMSDDYADDLKAILAKIPKQRRTGLYSATLSSARIQDLIKMGLRNPVEVKVNVSGAMPKTLSNYYMVAPNRTTKFARLMDVLFAKCTTNKCILFFNTCASVTYYNILLSEYLKNKFTILSIHGQMKQKKRNKVFNSFKASAAENCILLTTDVLARGIDFQDVPIVIQFDPPQDPSFFIHRSGRTARSGRAGESILMIEEVERGFIKYLSRSEIVINELELEQKAQFEEIKEAMMKIVITDRDIIEKGKAAFTSFIRSYKEHKLSVLFQFSKLNIDDLAMSFFLLRLPRVKEILGKRTEFVNSEINPNDIPFVDKNKEKQFNEKKQSKPPKVEQKQQEQQRKQTEREQVKKNIKNMKSIRKKIKQKHEESEEEQMKEEQRLVKKLKSGKITMQAFKERMKELDPADLESLDYSSGVV